MVYSENVKSFFDKFSKKYMHYDYLNQSLSGDLELKTFLEFLNLPPGSNLLDLGCGAGRYAIPLIYLGYQVTGVDISRTSLNVLRVHAIRLKLIERLKTLENDFREKVFENVFDGTFCIGSFHLLGKTIEERERIFCNMFLATKKGGVVLILLPNPYNLFFYPYYLLHPDVSWNLEKNFVRCTLNYMRNLFVRSGLKDIKIKRYGMLPTSLINKVPEVSQINEIMCDSPVLGKFSLFFFIRGIRA